MFFVQSPLTWSSWKTKLCRIFSTFLSPLLPAATAAKSLQSYPNLCDPIESSPPGSPVPGILQARTLEWVAISFSSAWNKSESEVAQSCPTLSDPMDYSLPGSSVHGIFQASVLEWGAIAQLCPALCDPMDCSPPGRPGVLPFMVLQSQTWLSDWTDWLISSVDVN